jgi:hypothetical protein
MAQLPEGDAVGDGGGLHRPGFELLGLELMAARYDPHRFLLDDQIEDRIARPNRDNVAHIP